MAPPEHSIVRMATSLRNSRQSGRDATITSYTDWTEWHGSELRDASINGPDLFFSAGNLAMLTVDPASPRSLPTNPCYYCGARMFVADTFSSRMPSPFGGRGGTDARGCIYACSTCGWWYIRREYERVIPIVPPVGDVATAFYEAIVKRFAVSDQQVPLDALRRHLQQFKSDIYSVDTHLFEKAIASVYADYFPGSEIRHVGGPGDNGIDIYAVINDTPCVIQVKRRASAGEAEGPAVVRELIGVTFSEGVKHGHLVTTADRFTAGAHKAARREHLRRQRCHIKLVALPEIMTMLRVANKRLKVAWQDAWNSCQKV